MADSELMKSKWERRMVLIIFGSAVCSIIIRLLSSGSNLSPISCSLPGACERFKVPTGHIIFLEHLKAFEGDSQWIWYGHGHLKNFHLVFTKKFIVKKRVFRLRFESNCSHTVYYLAISGGKKALCGSKCEKKKRVFLNISPIISLMYLYSI